MNGAFMNKTLTVRQILRGIGWLLAVLAIIYTCLVCRHAWNMKLGGAIAAQSLYTSGAPKKCKTQLGATRGVGRGNRDEFLLQPRTSVFRISTLLDKTHECIGWTVLAGIHGEVGQTSNENSSYREIYIDEYGRTVVVVSVEYKTPYRHAFFK